MGVLTIKSCYIINLSDGLLLGLLTNIILIRFIAAFETLVY